MDMRSFWSGFLAALALVLLAVTVRMDVFTARIIAAALATICALVSVMFSHDARRAS